MPLDYIPTEESKWVRVIQLNFIASRGDVLTLYGGNPQDVFDGVDSRGYIIRKFAGISVAEILCEHHIDDNPMYWIRVPSPDPTIPRRLIMNESFSKSLPLP